MPRWCQACHQTSAGVLLASDNYMASISSFCCPLLRCLHQWPPTPYPSQPVATPPVNTCQDQIGVLVCTTGTNAWSSKLAWFSGLVSRWNFKTRLQHLHPPVPRRGTNFQKGRPQKMWALLDCFGIALRWNKRDFLLQNCIWSPTKPHQTFSCKYCWHRTTAWHPFQHSLVHSSTGFISDISYPSQHIATLPEKTHWRAGLHNRWKCLMEQACFIFWSAVTLELRHKHTPFSTRSNISWENHNCLLGMGWELSQQWSSGEFREIKVCNQKGQKGSTGRLGHCGACLHNRYECLIKQACLVFWSGVTLELQNKHVT